MIDIAVIGTAGSLADAVAVDDDVIAALFDDATETWLLRTTSGAELRARVIVDGARTLHQLAPLNYQGHSEFRGLSVRWVGRSRAFEPAGQRVAVIGQRAAHVVGLLTEYEVQLFDCPLSWRTTKPRRLPRIVGRAPQAQIVMSPVDRIIQSGIRTADGADHGVDTIIYATGSAVVAGLPEDALVGTRGLTIQQAWNDGATAYLGVAVHGFPNYFMLAGPDSPVGDSETVIERQTRYIAECLERMRRRGSTRIEVRRSAERQFTERARIKPPWSAFELSSPDVDHQIYEGPTTLTVGAGEKEHVVRVRLIGHLDPIDGKYHWQGILFGVEFTPGSWPVHLAIDSRTTAARITERTPWGSFAIAGVGAPPFLLN